MNTFNPQSLKKLLYGLGLSVFFILILLIFRVFFKEDKEIKYQSFTKTPSEQVAPKKQDGIKDKKKLLLLPSN